jgi:O-acetyl-ADP-ribose deacetylase (regulator of RNase III)
MLARPSTKSTAMLVAQSIAVATLALDAIVNDVDGALLGGGGANGAIRRATRHRLLAHCPTPGRCATERRAP